MEGGSGGEDWRTVERCRLEHIELSFQVNKIFKSPLSDVYFYSFSYIN